jgi:hypothetical protein
MIVVITQVLRGAISHFNAGSACDGMLFSAMGMFVLLIWLMNAATAAPLHR